MLNANSSSWLAPSLAGLYVELQYRSVSAASVY
jgi:hypothetical protein